MKKRILSILLTVCMVLSLLPTVAFAADNYGIWVGTTEVTSDNANSVTGPGITGTVTYDSDTNTLTLNNANITSAGQSGGASMTCGIFKNSGDLNIVLHGTNTIGFSANSNLGVAGIYTGGQLSIKGTSTSTDTLSVVNTFTTPGEAFGIRGSAGVTIDGCTVTATSGSCSEQQSTFGIYAHTGSISILNAIVTGTGGSTEGISYGIDVDQGTLSIVNSAVTANGGEGTMGSYGLIIGYTVTISNSTVTATGTTLALLFFQAPTVTGLTAVASTNRSGTGAAAVTLDANVYGGSTTYKYVKIAPAQAQAQWGAAGSDGSAPTAWTQGTLADAKSYANGLGSGTAYIQLKSNVDISEALVFQVNKTTILDLNGYDINRGLTAATNAGYVIAVHGTLTVRDSSTTVVSDQGKITGGYNNDVGGGIYVSSSNSFTLEGGNITGNRSTSSTVGGGGVFVSSGGSFVMKGGSITQNEALNWGGGVTVYSGSFTMLGGNITGNRSANGSVYVPSSTSITVGGTAVIDDNTVSGSAVERNVYLNTSQTISVSTATPLTTGASIGVTTAAAPASGNPVNVTGTNSNDYSSYFHSDNSGYAIQNSGSDSAQRVQLALIPPVAVGTLSIPASFTAGHDLALSELDSYKPTVTANGATITAQGWQNSVNSGSWTNWPVGGVLPLDTSGTYKLRYYATYSGGTVYSNEVTLSVIGNTTALSLAASPSSPQSAGTPVTLTAKLTGFFTGPGVNGQTITFKSGGTTLGTATLNSSGIASYTWTPASAGAYSLTAAYAATAYNAAATSAAVDYTVGDAAPILTAGEATRTSDTTATVKFTSSEGGTYYYSVGSAVTDTSTGGTAFTAGETTISLTGLTAGAKDIYIVAKDASGNLSATTFKITIPAYAADTTAPTLTAGAVTRTSDTTATVKFTSSEGGTYYYSVGSAVMDTSTGGTAFSAGETTISLTGLTAGAKDIYIVAKDASGNVSVTTFKITLPAYVPTFDVVGTVKDSSSNALAGASVKLMSGQTQTGATVTTNGSGAFAISGIPNGTCNLVVSKDGIVVTSIITVSNVDYAAGTITLPSGKTNSVVEVKDNTPAIVVGNLDGQFSKAASDNDKGVTDADKTVVTGGGSVEIKLTAEKKDANTATNASNIAISATSDGKTVGTFIDLSVVKTVTPSSGSSTTTTLTELTSLIDVLIPLDVSLQGKDSYVVYRSHGSVVDAITTNPNSDGEKIAIIDGGATLKLTIMKFCTYAIGYTQAAAAPIGDPSAGFASPAITIVQSNGGKITVSDDKKTAAMTPDDGNVIADVLVDGKSVGATEKYTFTDGNAHTVTAVFVKKSALPYYLQNDAEIYIGFSAISGNLYKYVAPSGVNVMFMENPKNFTDNTIAWAKPSIDFVTAREMFLGTAQNTFSPNSAMTRAMFVTVIGRLYERSYGSVSGTSTFSDVDNKAYYAKYVAWANDNGIIKGIGENKFAPEANVTREQMAVIMQSFAAFLNKANAADVSLAYPDSATISSWAIDGAKYCQQTQVITGRDGGSFAPQESATRAEVAVILQRFIESFMNNV